MWPQKWKASASPGFTAFATTPPAVSAVSAAADPGEEAAPRGVAGERVERPAEPVRAPGLRHG